MINETMLGMETSGKNMIVSDSSSTSPDSFSQNIVNIFPEFLQNFVGNPFPTLFQRTLRGPALSQGQLVTEWLLRRLGDTGDGKKVRLRGELGHWGSFRLKWQLYI